MSAYPKATWRLLISGHASGAWNMAVDEALLESVRAGTSLPTLRFYGWEPACLSVGVGQPYGVADRQVLVERGWDVVRRVTGGRAILHVDELTYSVTAPDRDPRLAGGIQESYQRLSQALMVGIEALGASVQRSGAGTPSETTGPICFDTPANYEIILDGKKLVGSAQKRSRGMVLQHGTLPLAGDITRILDGLHFATPQAREAERPLLRQQAITLSAGMGRAIGWETAVEALTQGFRTALNLSFVTISLTPDEKAHAAQLVEEKYAADSWTQRR